MGDGWGRDVCGHHIYAFDGRNEKGVLNRVSHPWLRCRYCNEDLPEEVDGFRQERVSISVAFVLGWVKNDELEEPPS